MSKASNERSPDLDRALADLLADEGHATESMDSPRRDRILRRLEQTLGLPPEGGPGGGATRDAVGDARPSSGDSARRLALPLAALAVAAGLPLAASALFAHQANEAPLSDIRRDEAPLTAPPMSTPIAAHARRQVGAGSALTSDPVPMLAVADLPSASADVKRATATPALSASNAQTQPDLAEERALIASIRDALRARRFEEATGLLREHEVLFGRGQLIVEREALRVWLLEDTGQREAASDRATQFHESFPNSVLRSAVERRAH